MILWDCLFAALHAIRINMLRSTLTALGIIIGVGAIIVMVSVGAGAEARVESLIRALGANLIMVQNGAPTTGGTRQARGARQTVTLDDATAIQNEVASVLVAAPIVRGNGQVVMGNQNWSTVIEGVTPEYEEAREWAVAGGRWFGPEEVKGAAKVVLLGDTVARNLFPSEDPIGQIVRIRQVPLTVIGVLAPKGEAMGGQDQDDRVVVPLSTAKKRLIGGRTINPQLVSAIYVKARGADAMEEAADEVASLLRQRHRVRANEADPFVVRNLSQVLEMRASSTRVMTLLLAAVASVSLVVGGIGIMNIMLVSVTERTREIGLRIALGAQARDILLQFLIEAVTLSLIGGLAGVVLGIAGAIGIASLGEWPTLVKAEAILLAFGSATGIGIFFGFYPARKAAHLNPIDALRYE